MQIIIKNHINLHKDIYIKSELFLRTCRAVTLLKRANQKKKNCINFLKNFCVCLQVFKSVRSVCVYLLGPGRLVAAGRLVLVVVQLLLVLRRPLRVLLLLLLQRHQVRTLLLQLPLQPLGLPLLLDLLPLVLLHIRARRRRG